MFANGTTAATSATQTSAESTQNKDDSKIVQDVKSMTAASKQSDTFLEARAVDTIKSMESYTADVIQRPMLALEAYSSARQEAMEKIKQDPMTYRSLPDHLKEDTQIAELAFRENGWLLQFAPDRCRKNPDLVKVAVNTDGSALNFADKSLQQDRDIVMLAVTQSGDAIRHVHSDLRDDPDIINAALKESGCMIAYIDKSCEQYPEYAKIAVKDYPRAVRYLDGELLDDPHFLNELYQASPGIFVHLQPKHQIALLSFYQQQGKLGEILPFVVGADMCHFVTEERFALKIKSLLENSQCPENRVPENVHYVWFGKLPEHYVNNIMKMRSFAPNKKIHLWTDTQNIQANRALLQKYHLEGVVKLHNFEHFIAGKETALHHENKEDIKTWQQASAHFHREHKGIYHNYAAASDIARFMILNQLGGEYFDMDMDFTFENNPQYESKPRKPLYTLSGAIMLNNDNNQWIASKSHSVLSRHVLQNINKGYIKKSGTPFVWETKRVSDRVSTTTHLSGPMLVNTLPYFDKNPYFTDQQSYIAQMITHEEAKPNDPEESQWRLTVPTNQAKKKLFVDS